MTSFCEHGNGLSVFIKGKKILDCMSHYYFQKKDYVRNIMNMNSPGRCDGYRKLICLYSISHARPVNPREEYRMQFYSTSARNAAGK
jgi:hypothetical protein